MFTFEISIFSSEIPVKSALSVNISAIPIPFKISFREYDVFRESLGTKMSVFLKDKRNHWLVHMEILNLKTFEHLKAFFESVRITLIFDIH